MIKVYSIVCIVRLKFDLNCIACYFINVLGWLLAAELVEALNSSRTVRAQFERFS